MYFDFIVIEHLYGTNDFHDVIRNAELQLDEYCIIIMNLPFIENNNSWYFMEPYWTIDDIRKLHLFIIS